MFEDRAHVLACVRKLFCDSVRIGASACAACAFARTRGAGGSEDAWALGVRWHVSLKLGSSLRHALLIDSRYDPRACAAGTWLVQNLQPRFSSVVLQYAMMSVGR
eukprot:703763-Pleurochrysis_carterae.AAC.2